MYNPTAAWCIYTQQVLNFRTLTPTFLLVILTYVLTVCVSVTSAIASLIALHRNHKEREKSLNLPPELPCPACFTVCLINLLVVTQFLISVISLTVSWTVHDVVVRHYLEFLQFPLSNCALSALNPLIMLVRSGDFRERIKKYRTGKTVVTTVLTNTENNDSTSC